VLYFAKLFGICLQKKPYFDFKMEQSAIEVVKHILENYKARIDFLQWYIRGRMEFGDIGDWGEPELNENVIDSLERELLATRKLFVVAQDIATTEQSRGNVRIAGKKQWENIRSKLGDNTNTIKSYFQKRRSRKKAR